MCSNNCCTFHIIINNEVAIKNDSSNRMFAWQAYPAIFLAFSRSPFLSLFMPIMQVIHWLTIKTHVKEDLIRRKCKPCKTKTERKIKKQNKTKIS